MIDELKLLNNLKKGRRDSLDQIIKMYTAYVNVIVYNIIGVSMTKEDMEEVIADSFISLWRHAENIKVEKGSIRPYLAAIARNAAVDKLKELKSHVELSENIVAKNKEISQNMIEKENKELLFHEIMKLGEPDSEIFIRYYYYEEKIRTVAQVMEVPVSTVKSKLARGRVKLKENIIKKGEVSNE